MDLVPHQQQDTPFNRAVTVGRGGNAGAIAIESERAIAEAQGQLILAKRFPRDLNASYSELMEACKLPALANVAFYKVPRGGSSVTGPSIRLAEEIARVYGNFEFGHRELSRSEAGPGQRDFGKSEVEVYAWDKQTNNRSIRQITVLHVMDTKDGPRKLRDQKDIDDKIANVASKQARGRILAMMPKWMVEAAIEECKKTLAGANDEPISVRVRKMTQAFAKFGVNTDHIERYLGHKLDDVTLDELVDLMAVYSSIKEGEPASGYFSTGESVEDKPTESAAPKAIAEAAASKKPATSPKGTSKPAESASKTVKDAAPAASEKVAETGQKQGDSPAVSPAAAEQPPAQQEQAPEPTGDDEVIF